MRRYVQRQGRDFEFLRGWDEPGMIQIGTGSAIASEPAGGRLTVAYSSRAFVFFFLSGPSAPPRRQLLPKQAQATDTNV